MCLTRQKEPERRVIGFVVAIVTQLIQPGFKIRLMIAKLKRRQYAPVIGAMTAIMEQRDIPVRTQRVEEAQQRAR